MVGHTATTYCLPLSGGKHVILAPPCSRAPHIRPCSPEEQCVEEVIATRVDPCEAELPFSLPASTFQACGSLKWQTVIWIAGSLFGRRSETGRGRKYHQAR